MERAKKEADELADCSFRPKINRQPHSAEHEPLPRDKARSAAPQVLQRVDDTRSKERLIKAGVELYEKGTSRFSARDRRAEEQRRVAKEQELQGATFQPKINTKSKKVEPRYLDARYHRYLPGVGEVSSGGTVVELGEDGAAVVYDEEDEGYEDGSVVVASLSLLEDGDVELRGARPNPNPNPNPDPQRT